MGEADPIKIEEFNNFLDPQTKYLVYRVWVQHLHYTHNLCKGDPPPPVDKPANLSALSDLQCNKPKTSRISNGWARACLKIECNTLSFRHRTRCCCVCDAQSERVA